MLHTSEGQILRCDCHNILLAVQSIVVDIYAVIYSHILVTFLHSHQMYFFTAKCTSSEQLFKLHIAKGIRLQLLEISWNLVGAPEKFYN